MKTLLRRILRRLDLDLVRTHTTFEGHVTRLLAALDVNVVLDVGGHHGEYASLLREVGYRGRILSFEPVPSTFARLEAAMSGDSLWRGLNVALGSERGTLPINITGATDQTSFLQPSVNGEVWFGSSSAIVRTETVAVERLDDIIDSLLEGVSSPRVYLKLDTQGFETQVLLGAKATLEKYVVGMQTEIAVQPLYVGMPLFPDNIRPFLDLGFEQTGLFAVSRDPRDMIAAIEYDLVLKKTASVPSQQNQLRGEGRTG